MEDNRHWCLSLLTETKEAAIKKAANDIKKAVKGLNKVAKITKPVGTFTVYMSVPIMVAEKLIGFHDFGSVILTIVGAITEIVGHFVRRKNDWVEAIR